MNRRTSYTNGKAEKETAKDKEESLSALSKEEKEITKEKDPNPRKPSNVTCRRSTRVYHNKGTYLHMTLNRTLDEHWFAKTIYRPKQKDLTPSQIDLVIENLRSFLGGCGKMWEDVGIGVGEKNLSLHRQKDKERWQKFLKSKIG